MAVRGRPRAVVVQLLVRGLLSDSGDAPASKRKWPGDAIPASEGGGRWPDEPYKIVWQVRANGTHRIFPFFAPDWVRRSIEPMRMGTASGFTIEPIDAYYPKSPRYYVADAARIPCDWIHQRDDLYLMQWGRLGYDPKTGDEVFAQALKERFGAAAAPLGRAWSAASRIVPIALMAKAIGPDHRDHAPELEWGGGTHEWIEGEGLDTHVFLPSARRSRSTRPAARRPHLGGARPRPALALAEESPRAAALAAKCRRRRAARARGDAPPGSSAATTPAAAPHGGARSLTPRSPVGARPASDAFAALDAWGSSPTASITAVHRAAADHRDFRGRSSCGRPDEGPTR